jgi:hypothetical protein
VRPPLRLLSLVLLMTVGWSIRGTVAEEPEPLVPGQVLRGQFIQERVLKGFSAPLKTTGDFILAPGKGLIWLAREPFVATTVMTAEGISQRNGTAAMLNLPASKAPFLAQLYDILGGALAGDPRLLERHFNVSQKKNASGWHLALTPRQQGTAGGMGIADIKIDGRRFVDHVVIRKDSGDRDQLTFLGQSLDHAPLSAEETQLLARVGQP